MALSRLARSSVPINSERTTMPFTSIFLSLSPSLSRISLPKLSRLSALKETPPMLMSISSTFSARLILPLTSSTSILNLLYRLWSRISQLPPSYQKQMRATVPQHKQLYCLFPSDRKFLHPERGATDPSGEPDVAADGINMSHKFENIPRNSDFTYGIRLLSPLDPEAGGSHGKISRYGVRGMHAQDLGHQ